MTKLIIDRHYGLDNTTRHMRFTRVKRSSKIMQVLKFMILHPRTHVMRDIQRHVYHGYAPTSRSWGAGLFSALHHYGLATYTRKGHACFWEATPRGIKFWKSLAA